MSANWNQILHEIQGLGAKHGAIAQSASDLIRRKYLKALSDYTSRNVIAYYSGWQQKPHVALTEINDEDKNGFMMAVHGLDRSKGLDLILHTPGGSVAATESIVYYLRRIFKENIRAIVPQLAMSAGTMLACSCREIVMGKHSNLGPIDPHLRSIPAAGVIREFKRACREVKNDASKIPIWGQIIAQYRPAFLSQCENALLWSKQFVQDQLESVMFAGDSDATDKAKVIVRKLTDFSGNRAHDRHIHIDECLAMKLNVTALEDDQVLQDAALPIHHCYVYALQNSPAYKIIENHLGVAFVKNEAQKRQPGRNQ